MGMSTNQASILEMLLMLLHIPSIIEHKEALKKAGRHVNNHLPEHFHISDARLNSHDKSKFSHEELLPYAKKFVKQNIAKYIAKMDLETIEELRPRLSKLEEMEIGFDSKEWCDAVGHHYAN